MAWFAGEVTNPSDGQVIVDTGPLSGPTNVTFAATFYSSLTTTFEVQQTAANGTQVLRRQRFKVMSAGDSLTTSGIYSYLGDQERLRIVAISPNGNGVVSASIWIQ